MNVMVFDVPAESGGALAILDEHYRKAIQDRSKTWYFIVSLPIFPETENVKVLRFPWVKKSWLHRFVFDYFAAPTLIRKYKVDQVLSLQNVTIPRVKVPQSVYLHQCLPFVDKRFVSMEPLSFRIYCCLTGLRITHSVQKADSIIVQTEWMKDACMQKVRIEPDKIAVIPPEINTVVTGFFEPSEKNMSTFFYPASGAAHKNHEVIVESAMLLKRRHMSSYRVVFTLRGDESRHIASLYERVKADSLPIEFAGQLTRAQVFDYYRRSVLIFPSLAESYGLPMLEARLHHAPVLASDMPFAHEVLDNYQSVRYFNPENAAELSKLMEKCSASGMLATETGDMT